MEYRVRVNALFTCYRVAIYAPQKLTAVWMHGYIPKVILRENSAYFLQSHLMQFIQIKNTIESQRACQQVPNIYTKYINSITIHLYV